MVCTYRHIAPGARAEANAYAAHVLEKTVASDRMAQAVYYTQGKEIPAERADAMGSIPLVRADLDPTLAEALGIEANAVLTPEQLANLLGGRRADGAELDLGSDHNRKVRTYEDKDGNAVRQRISASDFCFSSPKSLSVAWALADTDAERWSLLQAHRDAVTETLRYMETEIAEAGFGKGHRTGSERGRLAWTTVEHFTGRPTIEVTRADPETGVIGTELYTVKAGDKVRGDPQLHTHALVQNLMVTDSGRLIAVNRDNLEGRIPEFGAVFHAMLAKNLRDIGVDVALCPRTLTARLPAVPEEVCKEFSRRTANGTAAAKEYAVEQGLIARAEDWDSLDADTKIKIVKSGTQNHKLPKDFGLTAQERQDYEKSARKDDLADFDAWAATAERIGYKHTSVVTYGPPAPEVTEAERIKAGWKAAAPILEAELGKRAVLRVSDARIAAARGLIASGAKETADVSRVLASMVTDGVRQQRKDTVLLAPAGLDNARARITTALHRDQEQEVISRVKAMAQDMRYSLSPSTLRRVTAKHDFTSTIGREQKRAIGQTGTGGAFSLFIGVGGSGKSRYVLPPLVDGWKHDGREVWGTALARRQADALAEGGIDPARCLAIDPLLTGLSDGALDPLPMKAGSVVVVDEFSQIGTRQLLELLRAAERYDFKVVVTGDERQAQSIESGAIIDLLRSALGDEAIPEILTIMRQKDEREREIATLLRGKRGDGIEDRLKAVTKAIGMKRDDGNAEMVPGGRDDFIRYAAREFMKVALEKGPEYRLSAAAPTNADAREISLAIRALRQDAGQVAADAVVVPAVNKDGERYDMALAPGDRIRLYQRTRGYFPTGDGKEVSAVVGNNGTVVKVLGLVNETVRYGRKVVHRDGLRVQTAKGKTAFVPWDNLRVKGTSRVLLAYGDCFTIASSQGITSQEHFHLMPGGSQAVSGWENYVNSSRHELRSRMLVSAGAELRQVDEARPAGVPVPTDWTTRETEAWDNVIANLSRQPVKETARQLLEGVIEDTRQSVRALQKHLRAAEAREQQGLAPTTLRDNLDQAQTAKQLALSLEGLATEIQGVRQATAPPSGAEEQAAIPAALLGRIEVEAEAAGAMVGLGQWSFIEAVDRIEFGLRGADGVAHPPAVVEKIEEAVEAHVDAFHAQIDATARGQAMERMEAAAGAYGRSVARGQRTLEQAVAVAFHTEMTIQRNPKKVAWPLSEDTVRALLPTVEAKIREVAERPLPKGMLSPDAAAGVERAAPTQGPRLGM